MSHDALSLFNSLLSYFLQLFKKTFFSVTRFLKRLKNNFFQGASKALHEYQFLPEQPSVRSDSYERAMPPQYYSSPNDMASSRTPVTTTTTTTRSFTHGNDQMASGYVIPPPQVRSGSGHLLPPAAGEFDGGGGGGRKSLTVSVGVDTNLGAHPITGIENPFCTPIEKRVTHEEDIARIERKRKVCLLFICF